jgi:hypothetical protein
MHDVVVIGIVERVKNVMSKQEAYVEIHPTWHFHNLCCVFLFREDVLKLKPISTYDYAKSLPRVSRDGIKRDLRIR